SKCVVRAHVLTLRGLDGALSSLFCSLCFCFVASCCWFFFLSFLPPLSPMLLFPFSRGARLDALASRPWGPDSRPRRICGEFAPGDYCAWVVSFSVCTSVLTAIAAACPGEKRARTRRQTTQGRVTARYNSYILLS